MMIRVPGLTDHGVQTTMYTEHVDLMPTLAEAALGITVPPCPRGEAILTTGLCTMGTSLVPLMHDPMVPVRNASFSQYPRQDYNKSGVSTCLTKKCVMGYSIVTTLNNMEYRYTEYVHAFVLGLSARPNKVW